MKVARRRLAVLLTGLALLLSSCAPGVRKTEGRLYTASFLNLFDTVTTIVGRARSEEAFQAQAGAIYDELLIYHRLFDIYNDYEGLNNLKTINDLAGVSPVEVDGRIIALLQDCKKYGEITGGRVNAAMGGVLALWHDARSSGMNDPVNARLPDWNALECAAQHRNFDAVIIDEAQSSVYISDPELRLDVGAIAKGWAVEQVAQAAPDGLLISVGGNVRAVGAKDESGAPWVIGIRNPDGEGYLHTILVTGQSVVTSGDYQRSYMVDGEAYHHIIDPDTLYPAKFWRSVSVVCPDSGLADALSTALFILPLEQGKALLKETDACAMWVDAQGEFFYSPGFEDMIRT